MAALILFKKKKDQLDFKWGYIQTNLNYKFYKSRNNLVYCCACLKSNEKIEEREVIHVRFFFPRPFVSGVPPTDSLLRFEPLVGVASLLTSSSSFGVAASTLGVTLDLPPPRFFLSTFSFSSHSCTSRSINVMRVLQRRCNSIAVRDLRNQSNRNCGADLIQFNLNIRKSG